ncbi:hypothetical protein BOW53_00625 [Solemya pervernicosa gill symbiont]|uniref:Flagellar protein FliT n=1 Tax=Solemya pervernicosa gill symbiont TaxID=642797 RepID=A0A1T2LAI0_9GAMM|nr:flagellar protein FliT [Solemya pervernicosa gill symbiont]OOZ42118.1 hypothetical protein BOW53_00625 [Solemya pervernicosa gill symbiont]
MDGSDNPNQGFEQLIAQVVDLSNRMFKAAEAEQWDELVELEAERRQSLPQLFNNPPSEHTSKLSEAVQLIIDLDKRTMALGEKGRHLIGNELQGLRQGQQATNAYNKVQG